MTVYENLTIKSAPHIADVAIRLANTYETRHAAEGLNCLIFVSTGCEEYGEPHLSATYSVEGPGGKSYYLAAVGAHFAMDASGGITVRFADLPMDGMHGEKDAGKHRMLRQFFQQALSLTNMLEGKIRKAADYL